MTVDNQHRAIGPRPGDEPTKAIRHNHNTTAAISDEQAPGSGPDGLDEPLWGDEPRWEAAAQGHGEPQWDDNPQRDDEPERDDEPRKAGSDRPSGVQVTASALAAVTATALLSTLGVAGTLIGAALSSVITVFANYLYSHSLRRTAEKVAGAPPVQKVRARTGTGTTAVLAVPADGGAATRQTTTVALATGRTVVGQAAGQTRTEPAATGTGARAVDAAGTAEGTRGRLDRLRDAWQAVVDRYGYRRIVVTVLAFFAAVLAAVTLVELAAGKPLSNVVRNEEGAGTSLFGGRPPAEETGTTRPASGEGTSTDPAPGTESGTVTEDDVTEPSQPAPSDQQPAEQDGSVLEPSPTSGTTPGGSSDGTTPSPSPSESVAPGPTTPGEQQIPGTRSPDDGLPAPDVQQPSVPEPVPAE